MKRIFLFAFLFYLFSSVHPKNEIRAVFGVQIAYQSTGQLINLVVYIHNGRTLSHQKVLTLREFAFFASGEWPSIYNPNRINYFEKENVPGGIFEDSITHQKIPYCFALDSLWKLRFRSYPFKGGFGEGWSQDAYFPSLTQKKYLFERYGVEQIDTKYFLDTSFWMLLRDVRDPGWISTYRNI